MGIPGSGKSTFAKKIANNKVIISRDEIRFSLLKEGEDYFKHETQVFKTFIKRINEAIANEEGAENIIIDATHLTLAARMKVLNRLNLTKCYLYAICFDVPLEVCLERNNKREGRAKVPEDTIKNMYSTLTFPEPSEEHIYDGIYMIGENYDLSY